MTNEENIPDVAPAPAPEPAPTCDASKRLDAARQFASEQYDKLCKAASAQVDHVREYTKAARHQINDGWNVTCAKAKDLHQAGEEYVKSNPTGSVLGALGVGVILGLLLGRRD